MTRAVNTALAGSGGVLQVVSVAISTGFSTNSTSYVDVTGFTASITPSSTSSKVLAIVSSRVSNGSGSSINNRGNIRLVRGATNLAEMLIGAFLGGVSGSDLNNYSAPNITFLDSPASTSAVVYKIQAVSEGSLNTISCGVPSTITLMEIAG